MCTKKYGRCPKFGKGDNGKSYLSFNRGEVFLEINQSETRIACAFNQFILIMQIRHILIKDHI
jgi:hypothetical protein